MASENLNTAAEKNRKKWYQRGKPCMPQTSAPYDNYGQTGSVQPAHGSEGDGHTSGGQGNHADCNGEAGHLQ